MMTQKYTRTPNGASKTGNKFSKKEKDNRYFDLPARWKVGGLIFVCNFAA